MTRLGLIIFSTFLLAACGPTTNPPPPSPSPQPSPQVEATIIANDQLCSQISSEFVTATTGVAINRVGTINDFQITACDYYLTEDKNSPYILIVLNKNLSVDTQKSFVLKQNLVISTDSRISGDHYLVTNPKTGQIVNINLVIDPKNFIRVDKNVDRAIDNDGLIKLASAVSHRLKK